MVAKLKVVVLGWWYRLGVAGELFEVLVDEHRLDLRSVLDLEGRHDQRPQTHGLVLKVRHLRPAR
jgi:hypothetical protein